MLEPSGPMSAQAKQPATALVLAGGGALGAYEAGVLHYVLGALPSEAPELSRQPRFELFAGTSVGALNVSFLAAGAKDPAGAAAELASFWRPLALALEAGEVTSPEHAALDTCTQLAPPGAAPHFLDKKASQVGNGDAARCTVDKERSWAGG